MILKKNNSGFVLLMSIVLVIFLGLMLEASSLRTNIELKESLDRLASQQAFYAAESGLQAAVNQLRINSSWNPGTPASPGAEPLMNKLSLVDNYNPPDDSNPTLDKVVGYYTVEVEPAADFEFFPSKWVWATGYSHLPNFGRQIVRSILARVVVQSPTNIFLSTAGDLHISSGANIDQNILGNNVFFDVNKGLPTSPDDQQKITVAGNVFYLQNVANPDPGEVSINGKVSEAPTEAFTGVDLPTYSNIAQSGGMYCASDITPAIANCDGQGNLTVSGGGISTTTLNAPNGVVYASGNITISGTVDSSMVFVAGGNIIINGSVQVATSDGGSPENKPQDDPSAPQVGLLAKGDVSIEDPSDNTTVDAFVMADGLTSGSQGGVFVAPGSPFSKGPTSTLTMTGAIAVRGTTTNGAGAVNLNAYSTRNYSYNTQFDSNLKIPFLPAIAKIQNWQEVSPSCAFSSFSGAASSSC